MTDLMNGFPPSPESQVTLANWRIAPFNRWAFQHVREIVPSADIPHDPSNVRPLPTATMNTDDLSHTRRRAAVAYARGVSATGEHRCPGCAP